MTYEATDPWSKEKSLAGVSDKVSECLQQRIPVIVEQREDEDGVYLVMRARRVEDPTPQSEMLEQLANVMSVDKDGDYFICRQGNEELMDALFRYAA